MGTDTWLATGSKCTAPGKMAFVSTALTYRAEAKAINRRMPIPVDLQAGCKSNDRNDQPRMRPIQNVTAKLDNSRMTKVSAPLSMNPPAELTPHERRMTALMLPAIPHQKQTSTTRKNSAGAERLRMNDFIDYAGRSRPVRFIYSRYSSPNCCSIIFSSG